MTFKIPLYLVDIFKYFEIFHKSSKQLNKSFKQWILKKTK